VNALVAAATAAGYGLASAFLPVVSAEVFAVVTGVRGSHVMVAVVALALGQTAGKLLLFESARRGTRRLARMRAARGDAVASRPGRVAARWAGRMRRWLARRRTGLPTVLVAATTGIPPLAVVSLAAGPAGLRRWEFAAVCLLGRVIRFAVLALSAS
jgi:membrane protein YqaA with SNARE-associated domain